MSFASQKNDMLLRNMIYSLNANMIGSTSSNMICLASPNVVVTLGWRTRSLHCGRDDNVGAAEKM